MPTCDWEVTLHMHRRYLALGALVALAVPAVAPAATSTRKYAGTTDQGLNMKLTTKAKKLFSYSLPYDAKCASGATQSFTLSLKNGTIPISSSGRFVDLYKSKNTKDPDKVLNFDQRTAGTATSSAAKGTHRTKIVVTDATGKTIDTCDTGIVTWELKRSS